MKIHFHALNFSKHSLVKNQKIVLVIHLAELTQGPFQTNFFHKLYHSRNFEVYDYLKISSQKFNFQSYLLNQFILSYTDLMVLTVLTFVRSFDHNSLDLNLNDSILDSKHIYTKFPTNLRNQYNISLTGNTPKNSSTFRVNLSLTIVPILSLTMS